RDAEHGGRRRDRREPALDLRLPHGLPARVRHRAGPGQAAPRDGAPGGAARGLQRGLQDRGEGRLMARAALKRLHELLQQQAVAIEEGDSEQLSALEPELSAAAACLDPSGADASDRAFAADVEGLRARNERRLEQRLAEVGSRISRIGYGRTALRAYSPGG